MHNESLADQVAENASTNGGGVFDDGETGVKFSKDETGVKFGFRLTNKQLFGTVAILVGTAIIRASAKRIIQNADLAEVAHTAVDKVEGVAA